MEDSDFRCFQGGERRKRAAFQGEFPLESNFLGKVALENSNFPLDSLETSLGKRALHREGIETVMRFMTHRSTNHYV